MSPGATVVLLSGPIGSGKTTLAEGLARQYAGEHVSTSKLIAESVGRQLDRTGLQTFGLREPFLGGEWIADAVARALSGNRGSEVVVVDAVRNLDQVIAVRERSRRQARVIHVHLNAEERQLIARYQSRARPEDAPVPWSSAMHSGAEASVPELVAVADQVIDTTRVTPTDVAVRVGSRIRRASTRWRQCVDALVGGQWGSEGKGNLAFHLAPEYDLLVRVGAPNAGHKVFDHDGIVYTHRQLPSGTRATSAPLLLGPGAVLDVAILLREILDCGVTPDRLTIDPDALVIEAEDIAAEASLQQAIGSTGTGGGAATARRIMNRAAPRTVRTAKDIPELSPFVRDASKSLEKACDRGAMILIEGTQGTGLSILHGSFPHVTSRDTTIGTLLSEVGVPPQCLRRVVVAFRTYPIRVGGPSGPMGLQTSWDDIARRAGLSPTQLRAAELGSVSHKERRVAEFSWAQLDSSVRLNGATDVALTFLDYLDARNRQARRMEQLTEESIRFIEEVEYVAGAPVSLISANFEDDGLIDRRRW